MYAVLAQPGRARPAAPPGSRERRRYPAASPAGTAGLARVMPPRRLAGFLMTAPHPLPSCLARRRDRELARHLDGRDQAAELADCQSPHAVAGSGHAAPPRRGRGRPGPDHLGRRRVRLRGARLASVPGREDRDWLGLADPAGGAVVDRGALALRSVFEPVMVAFYLWPVLAVGLIVAATSWRRLLAASVVGGTLTFVSQAPWRSPWTWWAPMVAGSAPRPESAPARARAAAARVTAPGRRPRSAGFPATR